jgi:polysaccharide export outer membrane protein
MKQGLSWPAYRLLILIMMCVSLVGCAFIMDQSPGPVITGESEAPGLYEYVIGPGDSLSIYVWKNPDISATNVPVRPDGNISSPLVEDLVASGRTPKQLAKDIERALSSFLKDPFVTVTVSNFVGRYNEQVRVIGEAAKPAGLPYRKNMTLLDVMIQVGGLTEFAAGNKAKVVRSIDGKQQTINVRLEDLIRDGDISANIMMSPGDILIIPESLF